MFMISLLNITKQVMKLIVHIDKGWTLLPPPVETSNILIYNYFVATSLQYQPMVVRVSPAVVFTKNKL